MEVSDEIQPWPHLSDGANELRRMTLESDDLRLLDLSFLAGRISVAEGTPRYFYDGITPGIHMGVIPDRLTSNQ